MLNLPPPPNVLFDPYLSKPTMVASRHRACHFLFSCPTQKEKKRIEKMSRRGSTKRALSPPPPAAKSDGGNVASGFILKLFQMVEGAPDSVVSWLPSGDAFKICDLEQLEGKTLPTYFRHNRFQSLVRQLNFYSFRKVNKERTFWVYRHPLFHRDRPEELHLLRRRTCPGVDGRKHRPGFDINSLENGAAGSLDERGAPIKDKKKKPKTKKASAKKKSKRSSSSVDDVAEVTPTPKKKRGSKVGASERAPTTKKARLFLSDPSRRGGSTPADSSEDSDSSGDEMPVTSRSTKSSTPFGKVTSTPRQVSLSDMSTFSRGSSDGTKTPPRDHILLEAADLASENRFDQKEQSMLVREVAEALDEHMKRAKSAAAAAKMGKVGVKGGRRISAAGTVTPNFITDTMKYNALTYDDDIVERDEDVTGITDRSKVKVEDADDKANMDIEVDIKMEDVAKVQDNTTVVTDGDESEDDATFSPAASFKTEAKLVTPVRSSIYNAIKASKANRARSESVDLSVAPVNDPIVVSMLGTKLISGHIPNDEARDRAIIARFCMSTAPKDPLLAEKFDALLASTKDTLAEDFNSYLSFLHPNFDLPRGGFAALFRTLRKSKLDDMLRDFSVFMINILETILLDIKSGAYPGCATVEASAVRKSIKAWRCSTVRT